MAFKSSISIRAVATASLLLGAATSGRPAVALPGAALAQSRAAASEWRFYGGDAGGMRFSSLKQINRENVSQLQRAWTYHTGEIDPTVGKGRNGFSFQCTPIVVEGVIYFSTPNNRIIALEAETGKEMWVFDPRLNRGKIHDPVRSRGVAYWEGKASKGLASRRIFFGANDGRLIALDALTGKPCADFGRHGEIDLRQGVADEHPDENYMVTSPPAVYAHLVIVGGARITETSVPGPSGDVRAFDARTGKLVWRFHTVPRPGEFGHETWAGNSWRGRSGVNAWGALSVDVERGLVFIPLGAPAYDHFGGDRKGQNLFANSIVALEAPTGKRRWHDQTVHHDIWDYDLPAQPNLITLRRQGRAVPAVTVLTKSGFLFVFDRRSGKPLFEIKEQPVRHRHTRPVYSYDGIEWKHFDSAEWDDNASVLSLRFTLEKDRMWIAHVPPYTNQSLEELLRSFRNHPHLKKAAVGKTVGSRDMPLLTVTNPKVPDGKKKVLWLMARQHSWEAGVSWVAEGARGIVLSPLRGSTILLDADQRFRATRHRPGYYLSPLRGSRDECPNLFCTDLA